jgi:hypothetical protein
MMPVRRRISIDDQVFHTLQQLALETGVYVDELADEAIRDLLRKYLRPMGLRDALVQSLRLRPANQQPRATVHCLRRQ